MHLVQVPPQAVAAVWPRIERYLQSAIDRSHGTHTMDTTKRDAEAGQRQLWVVITDDKDITAAGVTSLQSFPSGRLMLQIEVFGGDNMKAFFDLKSELEKWAKDEGCTAVCLWARKGWAKHLHDYQVTNYLMHKEI